MVRVVVHALILLVVIGMVLSMATSALASPAGGTAGPGGARGIGARAPSALAGPGGPAGPANQADSSSRTAAGPPPTIVLATYNLSWADLATLAREPDSAQDAAEVLAFARANEPVNLVTRTVGEVTYLEDGWTTLGAGTRMGWRGDPEPRLTPSNRAPGALASALEERGLSVSASGGLARYAVSPQTTWHPEVHSWAEGDPDPQRAAQASTADLTLIDTTQQGRIGDAGQLAALAAGLRGALSRGDARILVVCLADEDDPGPQMAVLPAGTTSGHGKRDGLVVGDSTHRAGLIQITDLTPTLVESLTGRTASGFDGQPLTLPKGPTGTDTAQRISRSAQSADPRLALLADDALHARASQLSVIPTSTLLIVASLALLTGAALVLRAARTAPSSTERRRGRLRRVRAGALAVAALPVGALLSNLLPWWRLGDRDGQVTIHAVPVAALATIVMGGVVLGLLIGADAGARRLLARPAPPAFQVTQAGQAGQGDPGRVAEAALPRRKGRLRPGSLPPTEVVLGCGLAGATCLGWLIDGATGAHLSFNGVLGMNAVVAGRFYGVSNTAFALACGALVVLIAVVWDLAGRRALPAVAAVAGLGGAALVLDGAPQLGADVGGALTLTPALVALAAGLTGWRLDWKRWLVVGLASLAAVAGFAALDLARPAGRRTHLGRFAAQVLDGSALSTVGRKAYALVAPFLSHPMALFGLFAVLTVVAVLVLRGRHELRLWRRGTSPYAWLAQEVEVPPAWLRPALRSLVVLTVVAVLLNDSGVTMAGFILVGAAPLALALAPGPGAPQPPGDRERDAPPSG